MTNRVGRGWSIGVVTAAVVVGAWVPAVAAQAASDLPPASQIIERFVRAVGGREALLGHKSRRQVGTFSLPAQGVTGDLEMLAAAPDLVRIRVTIAGIGEIEQGFDGRVAWLVNPMMGPMVLDGRARAHLQMDADFYEELHAPERFSTVETLERATFDGVPAYAVRLTRRSGEVDVEYFAIDSGLLVGTVARRVTPMGEVETTTVLSDYREFGGVKLPMRIVQRAMGIEQVLTIARVEFDTLDRAAFAPPPAIAALVK